MNRPATLLTALIVVVASPAVAPAAAVGAAAPTSTAQQADTSTSTARADDETANESDTGGVAAGARLSGAIGVQGAAIDGEVESRAFGVRAARASTDGARAAVVAAQFNASEERLTELRGRLDALEAARENGSISEDRHAARAAELRTEVNTLRRLSNETADVSETLPRETLEANGVNATAIEALRGNAANMTAPEIAAAARTVGGPGAGLGAAPGRPGGAADRPRSDGTLPADHADDNETTTSGQADGTEPAPADGSLDSGTEIATDDGGDESDRGDARGSGDRGR